MPHNACTADCRLKDNCGSCSFMIRNDQLWAAPIIITRVCCDCVLHCEAVKKIEAH